MDSKRSFLSLLNDQSDQGTPTSSKALSPEAEASERLRSIRSQDLMTKPLFAEKNKEDCESAPSAEQDSLDSTFPDIPEPDSPEASMTPRLRRMAASLGCEPEVESPAWERSLETPEGHGKPQSEEEELKPGEKKLSSSKSLFVETDMDAAVKK